MMFFGVTVQEIELIKRKNRFCKKNINCTYGIDDMKLHYSK